MVLTLYLHAHDQIYGVVQDCSNSIANALKLLQFFTNPSKYPQSKRSAIYSSQISMFNPFTSFIKENLSLPTTRSVKVKTFFPGVVYKESFICEGDKIFL